METPREHRLVHRGAHRYFRKSAESAPWVDAAIVETHLWTEAPDGGGRVQVLRDASKGAFGILFSLSAELREARDLLSVSELNMEMRHVSKGSIGRADYRWEGDGVSVRRSLSGHGDDEARVRLAPEHISYPLMRVFAAPAIHAVLAQGGEGTLLLPDIRSLEAALFAPILSTRRAWSEGAPKTLHLAGSDWNAQAHRLTGGPYDASCHFWIDLDRGLLLRYSFASQDGSFWRADLSDFEG